MDFLMLCLVAVMLWRFGRKLDRLTVVYRPAGPGDAVLSVAPPTRPPVGQVAAMLALMIGLAWCANARGAEPIQMMQLSPETRAWFKNPDGSCVQCSIGMTGIHCNDPNAASLLWDSPYGPAVRGGSWPSRVEQYCDQRGIKAWSVTGNSIDETIPWMVWAAKTGRFAAIGAGTAHFQTLYGRDPNTGEWFVCNNNSTHKVDRYPDRQFRQLHAESGPWCVILQKPSSPPPEFRPWWK
ncbi:hypothetical protein [Schlesneria paludicola]|uniref:hypothetical protein n=1 Tax=Schlesneria paludicola TaxID=360056 RepID=UPI00029AF7AF|nr:hypothetical protein [Schlesneria paludicola]